MNMKAVGYWIAVAVLVTAMTVLGGCKTTLPEADYGVYVPEVFPDITPIAVGKNITLINFMPWPDYWGSEVAERYDDAVLISAHGEQYAGEWSAFLPVYPGVIPISDLVDEHRALYPGRRIVLAICNPAKVCLEQENVTYALGLVWSMPSRQLNEAQLKHRNEKHPGHIGDIFEFVEQ